MTPFQEDLVIYITWKSEAAYNTFFHCAQERQRMSDRLEDTSLRLKDEMDLYKRMMDKLRRNRLEFNKEREATQEVGVACGTGCLFLFSHKINTLHCNKRKCSS